MMFSTPEHLTVANVYVNLGNFDGGFQAYILQSKNMVTYYSIQINNSLCFSDDGPHTSNLYVFQTWETTV